MGLLYIDSFDHYDNAHILSKWTTGFTLATIRVGGGRCGTNCMYMSTFNTMHKGLPFGSAAATVGFAMNVQREVTLDIAAINVLGLGGSSNTQHFYLWYYAADGSLEVVRNTSAASPSLGRSAADTIRMDSWYYIELQAVIGTSGSIIVRVNNVEVIHTTGVNTVGDQAGTLFAADLRYVVFSCGSNENWLLDDLYVLDSTGPAPWNTFLGDSRVEYLRPTANGAHQQWDLVGTAPTHWQAVDDGHLPDDDTTYLSTTVAGETDTAQYQETGLPSGPIFGAQLSVLMRKTDAGPRMLAPVMRHGGTDHIGASQDPSAVSYHYLIQIYPVNPVTGVAWTIADVNAAEFGVKVTE